MRRTSVVEGDGEAKTSERLASSLFLTRLRAFDFDFNFD
jgi:hypothetical protein